MPPHKKLFFHFPSPSLSRTWHLKCSFLILLNAFSIYSRWSFTKEGSRKMLGKKFRCAAWKHIFFNFILNLLSGPLLPILFISFSQHITPITYPIRISVPTLSTATFLIGKLSSSAPRFFHLFVSHFSKWIFSNLFFLSLRCFSAVVLHFFFFSALIVLGGGRKAGGLQNGKIFLFFSFLSIFFFLFAWLTSFSSGKT